MTFNWGLIHAKLSNHRLNTKISIEPEVVGSSGYIPFSIRLAMYMEHQRYNSNETKSCRII